MSEISSRSQSITTQRKRDHRAAYLLSEGGLVAALMVVLTSALWGRVAGACVVSVYFVAWVANYIIYTKGK